MLSPTGHQSATGRGRAGQALFVTDSWRLYTAR